MHIGQTHKFGNNYLDRYAHEAAYREDTRRKPNGFIFADVMKRCARHLPSRDFCGCNWLELMPFLLEAMRNIACNHRCILMGEDSKIVPILTVKGLRHSWHCKCQCE